MTLLGNTAFIVETKNAVFFLDQFEVLSKLYYLLSINYSIPKYYNKINKVMTLS